MAKLLRVVGALLLILLPTRLTRRMEDLQAATLSPPRLTTLLQGSVGRNTTLARLLERALPAAAVHDLVEAARPAYDLARLAVGRPFALAASPDGMVTLFTYGIDELRTLRVLREGERYSAEILSRDYETRSVAVAGEIESSLFASVADAGESDQLALDLAEIFAWDVDFNTELQRGDAFRAVVEKRFLDGRFVRYGRILSAEFARGERLLRAVRFESARGEGYYAPDGTPLRKAFLRSPLRFTRISSGFSSARRHPILRQVRAHFGIDYAAPTGTPVMAAADGVVAVAGWLGGYGRAVRLRHANGYETLYGHLSRVDVRPGQRVTQGQRLGAVGATGLATGPHLDYRMLRGGAFVNPLRVQLPPAEPIGDDERQAFAAVCAERLAQLAAAPAASGRRAAAQGVPPAAPRPAPRL